MRARAHLGLSVIMAQAMLPPWAIIPAAIKLIVQSFRHPNTNKEIFVDRATRHVSVVPLKNRG